MKQVFLAGSGPKTGTMGLRGFPGISPAHCWMISGYLEAMGRSIGASSLRMKMFTDPAEATNSMEWFPTRPIARASITSCG